MKKDTQSEKIMNPPEKVSPNPNGACRASFHCEPWRVPPGLVVGYPTRLLDIYTPTPLLAITPAVDIGRGTLEFFVANGCFPAIPRRRDLILGTNRYLKRAIVKTSESEIVFDARQAGIDNIAHLLHGAVGPALASLEILGIRERMNDLVFVVLPGLPAYSRKLLSILGFNKLIETRSPVNGICINLNPKYFKSCANAAPFIRQHAQKMGLVDTCGKSGDSVFIKRRHRRTAINLQEVEKTAHRRGFKPVFLEDLPIDQQISIVAEAKSVMAFHGAGMSYMYFRDPFIRGAVIELFSCGFSTSWARTNAFAVNDAWIGLQGKMEGRIVDQLYNKIHGHTYESKNFYVDLKSLELSIDLAQRSASGANLSELLASEELPLIIKRD